MNRKKIFLFSLIMFICLCQCYAEAFAQTRSGVFLENTTASTKENSINNVQFNNLIKQADKLLEYNRFDAALTLLEPYENYTFGNVDHWTNMQKYDWRMVEIYTRKNDPVSVIFFLNCMLDESVQKTPTKHKPQYADIFDANGKPTGQYYFGAAVYGHDTTLKQSAREKMAEINRKSKKIDAVTDPRMKYEGYPSAAGRRTRG